MQAPPHNSWWQAAAANKIEQVASLAQSALVQVGITQDHLTNATKQLGQTQQASQALQRAMVEQASQDAVEKARRNRIGQLAQASLVEAAQLQRQLQDVKKKSSRSGFNA